MHYRAKVDVIQPEVTKQLRQMGCKVQPLHTVGKGFGDLLVAYRYVVAILELKSGTKAAKHKKTDADQAKFKQEWGDDIHVLTVTSPEDAIAQVRHLFFRSGL